MFSVFLDLLRTVVGSASATGFCVSHDEGVFPPGSNG